MLAYTLPWCGSVRRCAAPEMLPARHGANDLVPLVEYVPAEFHSASGQVLLRWRLLEYLRMQP